MKRCMITITTLMEDNSGQTVILDISKRDVSVNRPKNSRIQVESFGSESQFELFCKVPESHEEIYLQFIDPLKNCSPDELGFSAA